MNLLNAMAEFIVKDDQAERAAFAKAMEVKLEKEKMTVNDLFFEIYVCQKRIAKLEERFEVTFNETPRKVKKCKDA